ncbi:hypothetical protein Hsar01_01971 [Haloferula sargassicola]|uniref:PEP-CTERM protein-sorting domain-containing protein n=2 Tax=Haloferula sargassicola TaxID=490096 RepID=A0ABP9USE2_9BACT
MTVTGILLGGGIAGAATYLVTGSFSMAQSSLNAGAIVTGDVFHYQFTVDGGSVDDNPSTLYAHFTPAITAFSMTRDPGNTGTWDPASGTFSLRNGGEIYADFGSMRFIADGDGMPTLEVTSMSPFDPTEFTSRVTFNPNFNLSFTDTGSGQTFEQMFGALTPSAITPYFAAGDMQLATQSLTFSTTVVPEPTALSLAALGATLVLRRRR